MFSEILGLMEKKLVIKMFAFSNSFFRGGGGRGGGGGERERERERERFREAKT